MIALVGGAVLSWLSYIAVKEGPSGLVLLVTILIFPVRILASLIAKDGATGEIVYWTLLTCVNALIVYLGILAVAAIKKGQEK